MKLKLNDNVVVIAGKDKGKKGSIIRILRKQNRVVVDKINMITKHIKKTAQKPGERVHLPAPLHASNVMLIDPSTKKRSRIGYRRLENGKKVRISKKSNQTLISTAAKSK
ncbi:50S ribosomal protein L24 [Candidatus Peregrinibacteria bacterium]|nr:50S ribosomal protein L24 [Candidatus Peregrinibacteria bacterium]